MSGLRASPVAALRCLALALALWLALMPLSAQSAEAQVVRIDPLIADGELMMDIDFDLELTRSMLDAAERGVSLSFAVDLVITAPRWWWRDRVVVESTLIRRLSYNTLTRQWRVTAGDLYLPVGSIDEAVGVLRQVRGWHVAPVDRFEPNARYDGRIRLRLDSSQLARPLQVDALSRGAWSLASPWRAFDFSIQQADSSK
jgi:hypothetical protein